MLKPELDVGERQKLNPSPTPSSLVGQAASEIETLSAKGSTVENIHERPLEDEIKRLYKGPPWEEVILNEPLDDKQDLLMESKKWWFVAICNSDCSLFVQFQLSQSQMFTRLATWTFLRPMLASSSHQLGLVNMRRTQRS